MIIPPPEADLSQSPIVGGADILEILQSEGDLIIEEVMLRFLDKHTATSSDDFMDALCCLFAMGLVDYESFRLSQLRL